MQRTFWRKINTVFFIGIGGISMSGLAYCLVQLGFTVLGSDIASGEQTDFLEKNGIKVYIGHAAEHIASAEVVVVNSAIPQNNPELCEARKRGIPVYGRAELLSLISDCFQNTVGIAGCHGKTTATAICAHVLDECFGSCSAHIGGEDLQFGNFRLNGDRYFVTEACEYQSNFLYLRPDVAVILNTDADHLDCYGDAEKLAAAYRAYARGAHVSIVCGEDPIAKQIDAKFTFGLSKYCDIGAENIHSKNGQYSFSLRIHDEIIDKVRLKVYGKHNIYNALAAAAVAEYYGCSSDLIARGIEKFKGIRRRFEFLGEVKGARIVADYAHHPREIFAALKTVGEITSGKVYVVFQPHTYSRTRILFQDFVSVLEPVENLVLYKTYAAREVYDESGSALLLSKHLPNSLYIDSPRQLETYLRCTVRSGDTVLFLGAGDIYFTAKYILNLK